MMEWSQWWESFIPDDLAEISGRTLLSFVIGDDVNLASRLVDKAQAGEILISEETYRHVKNSFQCEALGELMVKGKSLPIPMYRVIKELEAV